jgi:signal recognition particle GTPase
MEKDQVLEKLSEWQEFIQQISDHIKVNLLIEGKTIKEWRKYFYIKIPDDVNFQTVIKLSGKLWDLHQEAAAYRDREVIQLAFMEQSKEQKFSEAYNKARQDYQNQFNKTLAAKSCEEIARTAVQDLEGAIITQKVAHDFWVSICKTLTEQRKLLEQILWALNGESKIQKDINIYSKG